jgi:hypothetical protein
MYAATCLFVIFTCLSALAGPRLVLLEDTHDFGQMIQGDAVSHTFPFENRGKADLEIKKVRPSCGCTAGELNKKILKPGEKGEIKITFNSDRFHGPQKKSVKLETNAVRAPVSVITFTALVRRVWSFEPSYLKFALNKDGAATLEKEILFKITNLHDRPLGYVNLRASLPEIRFDRAFPATGLEIGPGKTFACAVRPAIREKIDRTRYGHLDVDVRFADGRTFTKRIRMVLKKAR